MDGRREGRNEERERWLLYTFIALLVVGISVRMQMVDVLAMRSIRR